MKYNHAFYILIFMSTLTTLVNVDNGFNIYDFLWEFFRIQSMMYLGFILGRITLWKHRK